MRQLREQLAKTGLTLHELILDNESAITGMSRPDIFQNLEQIMESMYASVRRGLEAEGQLPGTLGVWRKGHTLLERAREMPLAVDRFLGQVNAYAFAVAEENASGGVLVPAVVENQIQIFELVAGLDKGAESLALAHADDQLAGLAQAGGQAGKITVRRDDAEAVEIAAVQQVHRVNDHSGIRRIFAGGVAVLLDGDDRIVQQRVLPAFQPNVGPVAVDALASGDAEGRGLIENHFDVLGRNIVRVDEDCQFQVFHGLLPLALGLLKVHIELTRDHAVVDLAATGGLFAEVLFKICVRRDGVQPLCRVGLPDLAQRFGKACGLTGVAQALAVGRVRQDGGVVEGAEVLDIGGFKAAAVPHARQLCVGVGQGHGSGVDIVADALKSSILADLGEGFLSLFGPDISGDKVEMFGGKAAAQAGGQIQRFLRSLDDQRAGTAEGILHERVTAHTAQVGNGGVSLMGASVAFLR